MKRFAVILKTEMLLFSRDFFGFFFTLVFPVMMLLLFGGIYGNEPVYDGADMGMMDISVPAYSVMIMGVTGLMALPLTLSGYKEKNIYKRFDAAPAGKKSIIAAQVLVNLIMTLIGILVLLIVGKLVYNIQIKGDIFGIFTGILFSAAAMFSMGFLFTAVGRDLKSTSVLCYPFYFVMMFLSGATMPDMLFPDTIKKISGLLPMTYAVDLMQGIFSGDGLSLHGKELIILGSLTVAFTVIGAFLYKRKDWT
ncbi:MAG: ABC transporter permease [Oscillospiraceae bacterium]|nr:ABC transporter permease [Oscillospiraceae bacterium]